MKKNVFLALVLAVLGLGGPGLADEIGYGGFILSWTMPDFDELDSRLESVGITGSDDENFSFGGGFWGGYRNFISGFWGFERETRLEGSDLSARLNYSGFFAEPGYFVKIYKGLGVTPSLGIGYTKVRLDLRGSLGDVDFSDVLDNPERTSRARFFTFTLAPALAINLPVEFVTIQLRGGYMWSPFNEKWKLRDRSELTDAPDVNTSGIFAGVCLLFGGSDERFDF